MITMSLIRQMCQKGAINPTAHILKRIFQRKIPLADIFFALENGEIIESYIDTDGIESCLVLCWVQNNLPIHLVCALEDDILSMVTVYSPNLVEWHNDFKTRREKK